MTMTERFLGESIKKLGFGLMRLPEENGEINIAKTKEMVDYFMSHGFTYFDTAYVYNNGKSEEAAYEALVSRYPRESYQLATKLPIWPLKTKADLQKYFDTSLERTCAGYFDYYLLHALSRDSIAKTEELDAWNFLRDMKRQGFIKHYGFSFHDTAEVLDELLTNHPDTEFVQLQINYADWESEDVQAKLCYDVARKHNKPVIVMEPIKGGALAMEDSAIKDVFHEIDPDASVASWALRFAASMDGIITVLSGMSTRTQVRENVKCMNNFVPLSVREMSAINDVVKILDSVESVPCTTCKYCVESCPQKIDIPHVIDVYNQYLKYKALPVAKRAYAMGLENGGDASECVECHICQERCPQHIEIASVLKTAAETLS